MSEPYQLTPEYRLTAADARQWVIQKHRTLINEKTQEPYDNWQDLGYFTTVEGALRYWAQRYARESKLPLPKALAKSSERLEKLLLEIREATKQL